ncbi:MAG: glycosyltransferase family 2 protein [Thermoprotei archaeon]|nr:MAG: glycosyltransferase family 2 protein [Thermoprotei archaeon]
MIQAEVDLKSPLVSVIITTKDEEKNIENCLKSVINQTYKNIEIILVDNYSTDKTREIAKKYTDKIYLKGPERSAQRNYGAQKARGKYLLFLDADMILSPTVIEECVQKCEKEGYIALYIPERIIGEGFWIKVRDFERQFYTGTVIDAVRFIRRDIFFKAGEFDEELTGPEDWDLDRRIRQLGKVGIISSPLYHNEGRFPVRKYLRKKKYYFEGIQKYVQKWGRNDPEVRKQVGLWYRLIGVFIERNKWKLLLRHPILTVAMYYLKLRIAVEYLRFILRSRITK